MLKDTLEQITNNYLEKEHSLEKKAPPLAGIFGFRFGPKYDSCHEDYYDNMINAVKEYMQNGTNEQESFEAAEYIITAPAVVYSNNTSKWTVVSGQASIKPLLGELTPEHKKTLIDLMDQYYPKHQRVPLQEEIYAMLKK